MSEKRTLPVRFYRVMKTFKFPCDCPNPKWVPELSFLMVRATYYGNEPATVHAKWVTPRGHLGSAPATRELPENCMNPLEDYTYEEFLKLCREAKNGSSSP